MKIAFTAKGEGWEAEMDPRFGRTAYFLIYDENNDKLETADNSKVADMAHGAGPQAAQLLFEYKPDVLITGNGPGGNAERVLRQTGLEIYIGATSGTVKQAYDKFKNNELNKF
jgi:predicted Fe-Mo cluster-binding NifX family protein